MQLEGGELSVQEAYTPDSQCFGCGEGGQGPLGLQPRKGHQQWDGGACICATTHCHAISVASRLSRLPPPLRASGLWHIRHAPSTHSRIPPHAPRPIPSPLTPSLLSPLTLPPGPAHPSGLHLQSRRTPGGGLRAAVSIPASYCAFPGIVNGGIVSTLMDCHGREGRAREVAFKA